MHSRITRHATRLAVANDAPSETDFTVGQRIVTSDGFPGVISAVDSAFARGAETYTVTLDGDMGGGSYSAGQLRIAASQRSAALEAEADIEPRVASDWYPELGTILYDRPDPGRMVTVIGSLCKTAAVGDDTVYHGKNYYLPRSLYRHITDASRPVHERGHALARYLSDYPHDHGGMGIEWTDDASAAMGSAHYQGDNPWSVKEGAEPSGEHDWGVPVVYHAAPHRPADISGDDDSRGIPHNAFNHPYHSGEREHLVHPGSPVRWTGISWSQQPGNEESRSRDRDSRPRPPEEADADHWQHFRFPEGTQRRAALRREAAWYDEGGEGGYWESPAPWDRRNGDASSNPGFIASLRWITADPAWGLT
jgi:hypothetical protein